MKLSRKLTLSFILSILVSIFIISIISNIMINSRFENYLVQERENKFERIHNEINDLYKENYFFNVMDLKHIALSENINLNIKDNNGEIIYSTNTRMGMGMGMMNHHRMRMGRTTEGSYVEKIYPLTDDSNEIGSLIIGYIDNSYLTESALIFKDTLAQSFLISGLFTILIGFIVSIFLSKSLTNPLINIRNTANEIRQGNLNARSIVDTNTQEILELSDSINYLGNSLSQQENIRKRYASDISHELRTPLTTLKTHLEAIIDGVWEPTKEHLDILMGEISRLANLVDDLKDSFMQEEFIVNLNKTRFNISNELENIITAFLPIYNKEGYIINSSIENNVVGNLDKDKFKQIVNNLLSNSKRYLNKDGEVSIELRKFNENIILKIKDNGIGMTDKELPYIFDRFYRVDSSRNKNTGGTGLGLSIVKSIVEAHNGTINIKSVYEKGTEFEIILPLE